MTAYYNELDPAAAAWLVELIKDGQIAPGDVDARSIENVDGSDLNGYAQCHFFAGIGGWSLALRLAGWPDDREVWTGSVPCQPFSNAGSRQGVRDPRHLWPAFQRLIAQRRPPTIFGEQVASKAGREWLAGVRADLEALGYAVGAVDLPAACVGAPHIRQRLWWMAYADGGRSGDGELQPGRQHGQQPQDGGSAGRLANACKTERRGRGAKRGGISRLEHAADCGEAGGVADVQRAGLERLQEQSARQEPTTIERGGLSGFWSGFDLVPCADGKARRVESGSFPLAHGVPGRVGLLRGYGNAIVPQVAAEFIKAAK